MRAIVIKDRQLHWAEVPDPEPGDGEVVVDVTAAAVNRADLLQRQGNYPPPPGAPAYPGLECSGVISALGPGVEGHHVGERVCALLAGGGYAERVAVPAGQLLPVPAGLSLVEAAALPEVACTVWSNVVAHDRLRAGEAFLVHGGGSGIGTFAVQLGKALGATVLVTARSAKHERLRALGADHLIDYQEHDFVREVHTATGGRGADVILDIIGAKYLARNIQALAVNGRISVIGFQGGTRAELDLGALMAKRGTVSSTSLRARPIADKARIVAGVRDQVWPLVAAGLIKPIIDTTVPLAEAAEAQRLMEASDHLGKILLVR
ncbi:NAD(P)H quinone oxidoreductase [Actinoplanes sp. SE50]|uniref:NAD(P)H-quinone oxidoreductase n=1 Tax=unclassified Actinoplanes TaxID=2626549 RepID=UPI00023EDD44|nr:MULTISPECIES: NAD(P)H-quinone oxidoreductase [unclassified Actinoplanes]AEV89134.1 L-threonine 3-dehydrogenase [Actinoplanes sp. SE50/110]ATO87540.1 NAD(P)H quinone oxidoreductase [Actinoplanes sp. SE50]SLM04958.1 NAD(P)H quinone oxidoreductase [Actinoplanes sp. SE50/110]